MDSDDEKVLTRFDMIRASRIPLFSAAIFHEDPTRFFSLLINKYYTFPMIRQYFGYSMDGDHTRFDLHSRSSKTCSTTGQSAYKHVHIASHTEVGRGSDE